MPTDGHALRRCMWFGSLEGKIQKMKLPSAATLVHTLFTSFVLQRVLHSNAQEPYACSGLPGICRIRDGVSAGKVFPQHAPDQLWRGRQCIRRDCLCPHGKVRRCFQKERATLSDRQARRFMSRPWRWLELKIKVEERLRCHSCSAFGSLRESYFSFPEYCANLSGLSSLRSFYKAKVG